MPTMMITPSQDAILAWSRRDVEEICGRQGLRGQGSEIDLSAA